MGEIEKTLNAKFRRNLQHKIVFLNRLELYYGSKMD